MKIFLGVFFLYFCHSQSFAQGKKTQGQEKQKTQESTPSNDGNVIHLPIPQLSEDRRRDIVRLVKQRTEDARVAVRNIRRDVHDDLRELVTEKEASEDEFRRSEGALQQATDKHVEAIDTLGQQKEAEVMQV